MTIKTAITKAGYHPSRIKNVESLLLDPSFWKALGKSMGWDREDTCVEMEKFWLRKWIELMRHLAEGGTIESYFEKL
jgi:hypothetical protein